jgi:hypothetical protein
MITINELRKILEKEGLSTLGTKAELLSRFKVPKNVLDIELYISIREKVKKSVAVWPSAYASGQVVSQYKNAGGRYRYVPIETNLDRWFKEKWIDVCTNKPCGRKQSSIKDYPYCRPSIRVSDKTPKTVSEISPKVLNKMCEKKRSKCLPKNGKPVRCKL